MLDAGGGSGPSGLTNWCLCDVPTMWAMLRDQQTDNQWTQVSGWRKVSELTSTHLWRLGEYRDRLAEVWPPEKSPAAAAYLARLNYLIDSVRQTYDAAAANYTTLAGTTVAIETARRELKRIYDEYVAKQQQKKEYEERLAFEAASQLPGTTLGGPPVTETDLARLDDKARTIMYTLSNELIQAQAEIKQPPEYVPDKLDIDISEDDSPDGRATEAPPVIPPIAPVPDGLLSAQSSTPGPSSTATASVPGTPAGTGPVLGGVGSIAPPAPTVPLSPGVVTPSTPMSPVVPGVGMLPGMPIGPGLPPRGGGSPMYPPVTPTAGAAKPGAGGVVGSPRAMPPGGLIGGAPGTGLGQPSSTARRVNPVGGLISGTGGSNGRGSMSGAGYPIGAAQDTRLGDRRNGDRRLRWDPDNPWEVDEGVPPVVLPARDTGPVDPGPAIGLHR